MTEAEIHQPAAATIPANVIARFSEKRKAWPSHHRHIKKLNAIPEQDRGDEWREAMILLSGAHRRDWKLCLQLLGELRASREHAGEIGRFDAFFGTLEKIMHPYIVTQHGFSVPFRNMDTTAGMAELSRILRHLDGIGYKTFINSGTLLGAVRNGQLIGHDDDMDLAIILPSRDMAQVTGDWLDMVSRLRADKLIDEKHFLRSRRPVAKIRTQMDLTIDLFPAWISNEGRCFVWPHTFGELTADDVLPLGTAELYGIPMPAPKMPEKMLALNYGAGWREPDPSFRFPWADAEQRFQQLLIDYRKGRQQLSQLDMEPKD